MSFHGRVVPLRADQREHVALAAVLADQRRGQAEPAAGLQVGGHPEDRRRQQVHLVVDDQAPVAGVEQLEVGVDALPAGRHHLVRRDGDRPDLLAGAGVLADLVLGQRRAPEQLVASTAGRATVLVTRISVVALACAIAAAPTSVLPAPQGSTTTPEPPCQKRSAASRW